MHATDQLIPTRQSLLSRLKDWDDQEGWKVFFDTYWRLIYNAAIRSGLTEAEAQDVVQETIISVCKSMQTFEYDQNGSFKGWLMRLTSWRIQDQFRKRQQLINPKQRETRTSTDALERVPDPNGFGLEKTWDQEWEQNIIGAAIERVKRQVDGKQYQVFDLYVLKKWPVSRVSKSLGINRGKVYLAKHRINKLIKKEIEYLRRKTA